jgi:hypothetical protein
MNYFVRKPNFFDDKAWYKTDEQQVFEEISGATETASFRDFLSSCNRHDPWGLKALKFG